MEPTLSLAERRLVQALPRDGSNLAVTEVAKKAGFAKDVEALVASSGPERHGLIAIDETVEARYALTAEGQRIHAIGLPEVRAHQVLEAAPGPLTLAELAKRAHLSDSESRVIVGLLKKNGWASVDKGTAGMTIVVVRVPRNGYAPAAVLAQLGAEARAAPASDALRALIERGLAAAVTVTARAMRLTPAGQKFVGGMAATAVGAVEVNQITPELIAKWSTLSPADRAKHQIRPFDFGVSVAPQYPGKTHPLTHMIEEIRDIFVGLGFKEIAGDYVESAFWNMDTLFIPQDHPARDMQDTFYLDEPATASVPVALWQTVRDAQTTGGMTGSTGWGGTFTEAESKRALLRTHTTVTTIRHLAANPQAPAKVFGIGRVFRNEAMDATHLPEFHQIEGILMEEGADFRMLIGILREFYERLGFPQIKFKPSYYPYTEPSLDVAVKWGDKWLELGGAGIFRPEVTQPLGVKVPVLAWGLGLERLAMLRLGLKDIRGLYVSDVQWLRESPVR